MDSLRNDASHDHETIADAPGIEAPPMIGQDERRMHVRAYNFWAKLLDGRSFPAIDSLDIDDLGDFGANSLLLDFTSGIDNPAISYIGEALARECGLEQDVHYIADVPRRSLLSRLTDHYLQIIANRAPIGFEAEFVNARGETILYRGVLLPFSSDDDTIDFILGVINWKQAADSALVDAIEQQLLADAADIPAAHPRPTVPVWADGLDSPISVDGPDLAEAPDRDDAAALAQAAGLGWPRVTAAVARSPIIDRFASFDEETYDLSADDALAAVDHDAQSDLAATSDAVGEDGAAASLADRLASARLCADVASQASARGHEALYRAIGRAFAFAQAAGSAPDDYHTLLQEAGIADSPRSPMTPVAKLVFGAGHDKTRIAEVAAVLGHAAQAAIDAAALPAYLARYGGGLKGLIRDVRAAARAQAPAVDPLTAAAEALRRAVTFATIDLPATFAETEFSLLVTRRRADGGHDVVAAIDPADPVVVRALRVAAKAAQRA